MLTSRFLGTTFLIILFSLSSQVAAQFAYGSAKDIEEIKSSKTYVILTKEESEYNRQIKAAVEQHWKLSEFEFMVYPGMKVLREMFRDESNSVLIVTNGWMTSGSIATKFPFYEETKVRERIGEYSAEVGPLLTLLWGKGFAGHKGWILFHPLPSALNMMPDEAVDLSVQSLMYAANRLEKEELKRLHPWGDTELFQVESIAGKKILFTRSFVMTYGSALFGGSKYTQAEMSETLKCDFDVISDIEILESFKQKDDSMLYLGTYQEGPALVAYLYDCNGKVHGCWKIKRKGKELFLKILVDQMADSLNCEN